MISVEAVPTGRGWDCQVEVSAGGMSSQHRVRVSEADLERWSHLPSETPESLVGRAFEFLLAREPATQIMRSFELGEIQRFFPEFDEEIRRR